MANNNTKTNFEKIIEFQHAFEMKYFDTFNKSVLENNPDLVKLRLDLIREEVSELEQAIKDNNTGEVRDAIADILYVVYGMAQSFGINADEDFNIVHESNMSKLCKSEQEAIDTVKDYKIKYENGKSPYDSPYYYKNKNGDLYIVKNKSTGKVLKCINYKKVKFD